MKHIGSLYVFYVNGNNMNYNYFDKIDTEEKAYWLGFIFAECKYLFRSKI